MEAIATNGLLALLLGTQGIATRGLLLLIALMLLVVRHLFLVAMHLLLLVRHLLLLAMHLFREISLLFNFRFFIRFKAGSFMINGRLQRRFTVATTYSATAVALHGETPREVATSRKETSRNKCLAASNKCLTCSNEKLLETSDSLLVTSALIVVTRSH